MKNAEVVAMTSEMAEKHEALSNPHHTHSAPFPGVVVAKPPTTDSGFTFKWLKPREQSSLDVLFDQWGMLFDDFIHKKGPHAVHSADITVASAGWKSCSYSRSAKSRKRKGTVIARQLNRKRRFVDCVPTSISEAKPLGNGCVELEVTFSHAGDTAGVPTNQRGG